MEKYDNVVSQAELMQRGYSVVHIDLVDVRATLKKYDGLV
jgi:hypothetical protein